MARDVALNVLTARTPLVEKTVGLLGRTITERTGVRVVERSGEDVVELAIEPGIGTEGFRIEGTGPGGVRIVGNDERGLLYGAGKFLRSSRFDEGRFTPGAWRGTSVPEKPVRGMYFATHFHNFYHDAPVEKVERYVEEMALWGCNALSVWFDMHHYNGIDSPDAQAMIERLRAVIRAANGVGIGASLTTLANEAYANSPEALRAAPCQWHYQVELCPNKPGAMELLLKWRTEMLEAFGDLDIEYVWIWPYDQGGCMCEKCLPWGCNGFLKVAEPVARLVYEAFPNAKTVLSTWCFDYACEGEYEGLAKAFEERPDWVDYLMVDSHTDFPPYVLQHGAPGGLPMLNFPEISMHGMWPWGGFGANPLPARFQKIWDECGGLVSGGFPYSEGIYEDINKAVIWQFYWDSKREAMDTVREYAAYEFSQDVATQAAKAVEMMEASHTFSLRTEELQRWADRAAAGQCPGDPVVYHLPGLKQSDECFELVRKMDAQLTPYARQAWRWRVLYLRAAVEAELARSGGRATEQSDAYFQELTDIYCAEGAEAQVAPPVRRALKRLWGRA